MNQPREDLRRLASYVIDARIKAGFSTRKEFAAATGVTARTLGKLENASERVSSDTLARVARELHWTPDSPALVMSGGEPVPAARAASQHLHPILIPSRATAHSEAEEVLVDLLGRYPGDEVIRAIGAQVHKPAYAMVQEILHRLEKQGDPVPAREILAGLLERYDGDDDAARVARVIGAQRAKKASMVVAEILDWLTTQGPAVPQARNGTAG